MSDTEQQPAESPADADGHVAFVCTCYRTGCMFCDGGLFACALCNSFEGATTTHCPGEKMTADQSDAVYAGKLDYRNGAWLEACSRHTPAFWGTPEGQALMEQYKQERENRGGRRS